MFSLFSETSSRRCVCVQYVLLSFYLWNIVLYGIAANSVCVQTLSCHLKDVYCKSVILDPVFFEQGLLLWWYSPSSALWSSWFATCSATRGPTTPTRQRERSRPSPQTRPSSVLSRRSQRPLRKARRNGLSERPPQTAAAQSRLRWFWIFLSIPTRRRGGEGRGLGFQAVLLRDTVHCT